MTDTLSPIPVLPPPPTDPGEYITAFGADITSCGFDRNGAFTLTMTVHPDDKYNAVPLSDIKARRFLVTIHAPRGRKKIVSRDRRLVVSDASARRLERKWARAKARYFTGVDDEA